MLPNFSEAIFYVRLVISNLDWQVVIAAILCGDRRSGREPLSAKTKFFSHENTRLECLLSPHYVLYRVRRIGRSFTASLLVGHLKCACDDDLQNGTLQL